MADLPGDPEWRSATWEGARRAMLRRALRRDVRERLETLHELARTSDRLAEAGRRARDAAGSVSSEA